MNVLLINGSPHKEGNTYTALAEVAKTLEAEGIETEIAWIGVKPVRGCIACGTCIEKQNGVCVFADDPCNTMIEKLRAADGLVVGSPVYYGQPTGQVMSLLQRMFFAGGAAAQNKPAAAVCVCRRGGATSAFQTLQMPFQMMNMPVATSQYWNIAYGQTPGQASLDAEGMQTMRTLGHNMATMLGSMAANTAPIREPIERTNFIR